MRQKPFTKEQRSILLENAEIAHETGESQVPAVKFFCPWGAATWLISEIKEHANGEVEMFGLCDLGHGSPELGYVLLSELDSLKGPFGLTIERDLYFDANDKTLTEYADEARAQGRIAA